MVFAKNDSLGNLSENVNIHIIQPGKDPVFETLTPHQALELAGEIMSLASRILQKKK